MSHRLLFLTDYYYPLPECLYEFKMEHKEKISRKSERWSKAEIKTLINAFKVEPCMYASDQTIYRNKHLRGKALDRILQKMLWLRPTTTKEECQQKFKNLRNQFNIENAKVKASLKSATGVDDVYHPNLWYFTMMLFLDTYVTPRKNRNSLKREIQNPLFQSSSTVKFASESEITSDPLLSISATDSSPAIQDDTTSTELTSPPFGGQETCDVFVTPGPISPAFSTSLTSGVPSGRRHVSKKRIRQCSTDDEFSDAINNLAGSLKLPVVTSNAVNTAQTTSEDPSVDGFVSFVGALLRSFKDEELKLEVMNTVVQTVIEAKETDLQRAKKS